MTPSDVGKGNCTTKGPPRLSIPVCSCLETQCKDGYDRGSLIEPGLERSGNKWWGATAGSTQEGLAEGGRVSAPGPGTQRGPGAPDGTRWSGLHLLLPPNAGARAPCRV